MNDIRQGAQSGQPHSADNPEINNVQVEALLSGIRALVSLLGPCAPAIIPGCLYTRPQVETNLGISDHTTTLWFDNGLPQYRPGTKSDLMLGSEIIDFIKANPQLKHPENYQAKLAQRKKGRKK